MLDIQNDGNGTTSLTINLNPAQAAAIGFEGSMIADFADSMFLALAIARTGKCSDGAPATASDWETYIRHMRRLGERLDGIMDAGIRAHTDLGGSTQDLADALSVPRATAQYRRECLRERGPEGWEPWANGSLND